jgi:hypothetical protein
VPLTCNEFGVYEAAAAEDRAAYLHDLRLTLEEQGIGWTVWDYAGGFSIAGGGPGQRRFDPTLLGALGLPAN